MPSYIATPSLWRTGWRCEGKTEDLGAPPRTPLRGLLSEKPPKNPKNFTAQGNRMVGRKEFLRAANPVALCGEVSGSSSPLGRRLYAEIRAAPRGPRLRFARREGCV